MLINKEEVKLHALIKDPIARLLFLNCFFVIAGYGLFSLTGGASVNFMRLLKNVFIFFSFGYLIVTNKIVNPGSIFESGFVPVIFGVLILYVTLGSGADIASFGRILTFFLPFLYVYLSLSYLIANFGIQLTLKGMHWGILITYSLPLIAYILSGGKITDTNIYEQNVDSQVFTSNNYGWSSTLYILSFLYVWKDIKMSKPIKLFFGILMPVAILLFFASANRSSWLSMSVAMIPFFFYYKGMRLQYKIAGILIVIGFISVLLADPNSSINFALNKTQKQEEVGEARFTTAKIVYDHFNGEPTLWITGMGMFNFKVLKGNTNLGSYHNSYYEVLFGAGIPLFLVFLSFMFFRPGVRFIKYYSKYTLLLPPLMIIPFFESDLTGGQFLFFPWFAFMLLLNAKTKFWNRETFNASKDKREILADAGSVDNAPGNLRADSQL